MMHVCVGHKAGIISKTLLVLCSWLCYISRRVLSTVVLWRYVMWTSVSCVVINCLILLISIAAGKDMEYCQIGSCFGAHLHSLNSLVLGSIIWSKRDLFCLGNIFKKRGLSVCLGAWRSGLRIWLVMCRSWVRALFKASVVSLTKKLNTYYLVFVDSRKGFERDFTIELKLIESLMENWLKCHISPLVKYRQKKTKNKQDLWMLNTIII